MVEAHNDSGGGEESFAALFEESLKREEIKEGAIVRGRVIQLTKDYVVVDIGYRYQKIFTNTALQDFLSAGDGFSSQQARVGVGVRF